MENTTLSESFKVLKDPRLERAKRHSLINIITIAICAVICGADNFVSMASFGRAKKEWFETFLDLPNGVPSHEESQLGTYMVTPYKSRLHCFFFAI